MTDNTQDHDKSQSASLPLIDCLKPAVRLRVASLLEQLDQTVMDRTLLTIKEDDLKEELERLQKEAGVVGFRHGWLTFCCQPVAGRKTLDKLLLIENGCPASVLKASYVTGKPSTRTTFKHLEEDE